MLRDNCGWWRDDGGGKQDPAVNPQSALDNPQSQRACSIHQELEIVPGDMNDYESLAAYHYRDNRPAVVKAVYTIRPKRSLGALGRRPAGVIVYAMPNPRIELRTIATAGAFSGLDRQTELEMLNRHVRCLARVIVEPRFRGIGLAVRLVRATMPRLDVPIVEALGVMPRVNPFLERAGMRPFAPRVPVEHVALLEALSVVGIEEGELVDPERVQQKLDRLAQPAGDFLEVRMRQFLKSHGSRRTMPGGIERTRYLLGKLTHRPAYYIWINPSLIVDGRCLISDARCTPSSINHQPSNIKHQTSHFGGHTIMSTVIRSIPLDKLVPHPDHPSRMSRAAFEKLVRNIERTGRYEPLVVRPCPGQPDCFQIINGHRRGEALRRLGHETAEAVVWDVDDEQTDILLATLNRLQGRDTLDKKRVLLRRLSAALEIRALARLLPQTCGQLDRLASAKPLAPSLSERPGVFAKPMVFFVDPTQEHAIEEAIARATTGLSEGQTRALRRAAALTCIARGLLDRDERASLKGGAAMVSAVSANP
jgi:ParB-like chromosome segregation protein Spo0J